MADLFQVKVPTINEHLKTLYAEGGKSSPKQLLGIS